MEGKWIRFSSVFVSFTVFPTITFDVQPCFLANCFLQCTATLSGHLGAHKMYCINATALHNKISNQALDEKREMQFSSHYGVFPNETGYSTRE